MDISDFKEVEKLVDELNYTRMLLGTDAISLIPNGGGGKTYWWVGGADGKADHERSSVLKLLKAGLAKYEEEIIGKLETLGVSNQK